MTDVKYQPVPSDSALLVPVVSRDKRTKRFYLGMGLLALIITTVGSLAGSGCMNSGYGFSNGKDSKHLNPGAGTTDDEFEPPYSCHPAANIRYDPQPAEWSAPVNDKLEKLSVVVKGVAHAAVIIEQNDDIDSIHYNVHYHLSAEWLSNLVSVKASSDSPTFELEVNTPDHQDMPHGQCIAVAVHVQVPSDLREGLNLSAKASNGLIEVRDADSTFDHVKFRLRNGAIMARKLRSKDLDARTRNGRIALESITSDKVELSSHNGAVATGLVTADTIKLSAKNGAVSGRFEKFSQLEARTTNGAVNAACVVDDDKKPHMNFQSVNGRIEARISDNFSGHFEALAKVGKVSVKGDGIEFTERHRFLPAKEVGWRNGHGEMIVEASTATGHVNLEFGPL